MKTVEFLCDHCGNETIIEMFSVDDEAEYCPICGKSKEHEGDFDGDLLDWDE